MIKYHVSNRSAFLINPDNNNSVTVPVSDCAYPLIKYFIQSNRIEELKFFTDVGHKISLNNITIESTRTHGFNIHINNNSYSTFPSMYEKMISKISSYEIDKIISVDDIINEIKNQAININTFDWLGNKIRFAGEGLYAKGKYHEYFINFDTNSMYCGKDFICVHVSDYKDPFLNEKEICILTKALLGINDAVFFPKYGTLRRFIT